MLVLNKGRLEDAAFLKQGMVVTLMTAIFNNISWTSHRWVSIPSDTVSALTNRRLTAKFLYPADAAESTVGSNRFLIRAIITSGSRPITVKQAKIPEIVSKYMLCLQMSRRRETSCFGKRKWNHLVSEIQTSIHTKNENNFCYLCMEQTQKPLHHERKIRISWLQLCGE